MKPRCGSTLSAQSSAQPEPSKDERTEFQKYVERSKCRECGWGMGFPCEKHR